MNQDFNNLNNNVNAQNPSQVSFQGVNSQPAPPTQQPIVEPVQPEPQYTEPQIQQPAENPNIPEKNKKSSKGIIFIIIALILVGAVVAFLMFKKGENSKGLPSSTDKVDIQILGKKTSFPVKVNFLLENGFKIPYESDEKKLTESENESIEVLFKNTDVNFGSKYSYPNIETFCKNGKANSLNDAYAIEMTVRGGSYEDTTLTVEGYGVGYSYSKFREHMDPKYEVALESDPDSGFMMEYVIYIIDNIYIRAVDTDSDDIIDMLLIKIDGELSNIWNKLAE